MAFRILLLLQSKITLARSWRTIPSSFFSSECHRSHRFMPPPSPKKIPFTVSVHGKTWQDPYHWMSNTSDLKDHLHRENSYAEAFMADTHRLQCALSSEMKSRIPATIFTPPERWGPWLYYQYIPEGKEYPVLCRKLETDRIGWLKTFLHYAIARSEMHQIYIQDLKPWYFPLPSNACSAIPCSNHDSLNTVYRVVVSSPVMQDVIVDNDMSRHTYSIMHQEEVNCDSGGHKNQKAHSNDSPSSQIRWTKPELGWVKLNVDGSRDHTSNPPSAGCGGVLRDASGNWLLGFAQKLDPSFEVHQTELEAILKGLELACDMNVEKLIVESDSESAVSMVENGFGGKCNHPQFNMVSRIRELRFDPKWEVKVVRVPREANRVANRLAKDARDLPFDYGRSNALVLV